MGKELNPMIRPLGIVLAVSFVFACGGGASTPTSPSRSVAALSTTSAPPFASPSRVPISAPITDTVTGAVVGRLEQDVDQLPVLLPVSLSGYVTRQAWITTASSPVDLIPEAGFDLAFYRQLARDDFDRIQGRLQPLWVLPQAPSFYMETDGEKGFARSVAARLEMVARRVVPALTGGRFQVAHWETGPTPRPPQRGWIVIERKDDIGGPDVPPGYVVCGSALIGGLAGQVWLHGDQVCRIEAVFAHELGHALGFFHVDRRGAMMYPYEMAEDSAADAPIDAERSAAAIAYARPRGSRDIDVDPMFSAPSPLQPMVVK
jgi:hypothetical protein